MAKTQEAVLEMRNAFEHIDERAEGKVGGGRFDADALTIFNQSEFVESSILRHRDHRLNFETDVIAALVDSRDLIMDAIDARAKQQARRRQNLNRAFSRVDAECDDGIADGCDDGRRYFYCSCVTL